MWPMTDANPLMGAWAGLARDWTSPARAMPWLAEMQRAQAEAVTAYWRTVIGFWTGGTALPWLPTAGTGRVAAPREAARDMAAESAKAPLPLATGPAAQVQEPQAPEAVTETAAAPAAEPTPGTAAPPAEATTEALAMVADAVAEALAPAPQSIAALITPTAGPLAEPPVPAAEAPLPYPAAVPAAAAPADGPAERKGPAKARGKAELPATRRRPGPGGPRLPTPN